MAAPAQGQTVDRLTLTIRYPSTPAVLPAGDAEGACKALGEALGTGPAGPWGPGPFAEVACPGGPAAGEGVTAFTLVVAAAEEGRLTFKLSDPGGSVVAEVATGESERPLDLLAIPEVARRVAAILLDGLPARWRLGRGAVAGVGPGKATLVLTYPAMQDASVSAAAAPIPPPKTLTLYSLAWDGDSQLWRPRVVGTATRRRLKMPTRRAPGRAVYALPPAAAAALTGEAGLWAHASGGPGGSREAARSAFEEGWEAAADEAAARLASPLTASATDVFGYAGGRFGVQLLKGDPLLEKTRFVGVLVEIRSGWLKGLQYFYDKVLKTEVAQPGILDGTIRTKIDWSRHVLGYTFGLGLPWLVDRVTLTPKIGVWSFAARVPAGLAEDGGFSEVRVFDMKNAISLGAEVGLESRVGRVTMRPWGGVDFGWSPLGDDKRVTSRRAGGDLYVAGPGFKLFGAPVRIAVLGFGFVESVTLASTAAAEDEAALAPPEGEPVVSVQEVTARRVDYVAGYAGFGLALSW